MVPQGQALGNKPGPAMPTVARRALVVKHRSLWSVALTAKSSTIANMQPVTNPHDRFFKQGRSNSDTARDFIQHCPPADVVAHLDLDALELSAESFVDALQSHHTDPLFVVKLLDGDDGLVHVLLNHYLLWDLAGFTDDEVRGEVMLQATLLVVKHILRDDFGPSPHRALSLLSSISGRQTGLEYIETLLRYVVVGAKHTTPGEWRNAVYQVFPEGIDDLDVLRSLQQAIKAATSLEQVCSDLRALLA